MMVGVLSVYDSGCVSGSLSGRLPNVLSLEQRQLLAFRCFWLVLADSSTPVGAILAVVVAVVELPVAPRHAHSGSLSLAWVSASGA